MYANYHTHTPRCHHADGAPRKYIENAAKSGMKILGFSDHVPYPFGCDYISGCRMSVEETEGYVEELLALREEYKDQIQLLIGYEAEYYPACFDAMLKNIRRYECDYLIMGQHFLDNEYDGPPSGQPTKDKGRLTRYVDQVLEGIGTGVFSYIAHPDVMRYEGDEAFYQEEMRRLCEGARALAIPLEINCLGIMENRHYPSEHFWKIVGEVGNDVVIGCDAHRPSVIGDEALEEESKAFAARFGLKPLTTIQLRSI